MNLIFQPPCLLLHGDFSQNRDHSLSSQDAGISWRWSKSDKTSTSLYFFQLPLLIGQQLSAFIFPHQWRVISTHLDFVFVMFFYRAMLTSSRSSTYALSVSTSSARSLYSFFSFFFLDEDWWERNFLYWILSSSFSFNSQTHSVIVQPRIWVRLSIFS